MFHTMRGEFYALVNKCPHKQGPLSQGIVHGDSVTCPLHNWKISLRSGRGARRRRGLRADDPGQGRRRAHLPVARGGRAASAGGAGEGGAEALVSKGDPPCPAKPDGEVADAEGG